MGLLKKILLCQIAGLLLTAAAAAYDNDDCIACHSTGSGASRLTIDVNGFNASIHSDNAACGDCHSLVVDDSHSRTPGSGAVDCGACHDQQNRHGIDGEPQNRPQCAACHTAHHIRAPDDPASAVYPANLKATCGRCHPSQSGHVDYFSRLPAIKIKTHPKGDLAGDYSAADCLGCHQGRAAHGESEPIDDAGCDRCHLTADGRKVLLGFIHPRADWSAQPGVFVVGVIYQLVVLACIGGGLIFFVRRLSGTRRR